MKKIICIITICVMGCFLLTGCGNATQPLSSIYDEEVVINSAISIIEDINRGDYEAVYKTFRYDLAELLPTETIQTTFDPIFETVGEFVEYRSTGAMGQTDSESGEEYAAAVIVAKYQYKKLTYSISYDENMEVIGIFVK